MQLLSEGRRTTWSVPSSHVAVAALLLFAPLRSRSQEVIAWGNNTHGQTSVPAQATNVIAVAGGASHSLALRADGSVIAWGSITNVPIDATNVIRIAAGAAHSLALRADGKVIAWGDNAYGQVDVPTTTNQVVGIAAGHHHNLALLADGNVLAWGKNTYGQTDVPTSLGLVVCIAAGAEHSVVMQTDGVIHVFGGADVPPLSHAKKAPTSYPNQFMEIAAAASHNLFLSAYGRAQTTGTITQAPSDTTNLVAIAVGTNHNLALRANGRLAAWGGGPVTNLPPAATNITAIGSGFAHALAIKGSGHPHLLGSPAYHGSVLLGEPLPLAARAVGSSPLRYQWFADQAPLHGETNRTLSGLASLETGVTSFFVVISNLAGTVTSDVVRLSVREVAIWDNDRVDAHGLRKIPWALAQPRCIGAGGYHWLGVSSSGTVFGWGKNTDGQAAVPVSATNVVAVAAGSDHSLALRSDGIVVAWGRNHDGQSSVPAEATNVVAVAAGWAHSLALRADGTIVAWGNNDFGQTSVSFLAMRSIAVSAGYYHSLALLRDGRVVAWGNQNSVPDAATNVTAISAGWGHNLALKADGTVLAWGENEFGQCNVPTMASNVVAVGAGWFSSFALRADGHVLAWGGGFLGMTNVPTTLTNVTRLAVGENSVAALTRWAEPSFHSPVSRITSALGGQAVLAAEVDGARPMTYQWYRNGQHLHHATNQSLVLGALTMEDEGIYELVACNAYGCATNKPVELNLRSEAQTLSAVGCWGDDVAGQCRVPPSIASPRSVAAGALHSLVLTTEGRVIAWGKNTQGQTSVPVDLTNVVSISAGGEHSLALKADGTISAWGSNWDGQSSIPPIATNVTAIASGWAHNLALRGDGTVVAWGDNHYGQTNCLPWLKNVRHIAAGYHHSLALCWDGSVAAWGSEDWVPTAASNVVDIAAGWEHSLALRADGTIVAWGDNRYGQTALHADATNVVRIAAGWGISAAVRADGTLLVWGKTAHRLTEVPPGLANTACISVGADHIMAIVEVGPPRFLDSLHEHSGHAGSTALLKADVVGTQPLEGHWTLDGVAVEGASSRHLMLPEIQDEVAGLYSFIVTNGVGQTGALSLTLTVRNEPSVEFRVGQQNIVDGESFCLSPIVTGASPLTYQWQKDGMQLLDSGQITGSSARRLCVSNASLLESGDYLLSVSNAYGTAWGAGPPVAVTSVVCWGDASFGQSAIPPNATNLISVAAGGYHSLGLHADGRVVAWGDNTCGQLDVPASATPAQAVAAGDNFSLALKPDGGVIAWGKKNPQVPPVSNDVVLVPSSVTNVVDIAAGNVHAMALRRDGSIIVWGATHAALTNAPLSASNTVAIATGGSHALALRADGHVIGWGNIAQPPVSATNAFAIAAGRNHGLALRVDGTLLAWGSNRRGQQDIPMAATNILAIAARDDCNLALRRDGVLLAWGDGFSGQNDVPPSACNATAIAVGGSHTLALVNRGLSTSRQVVMGTQTTLIGNSLSGDSSSYQWRFNGLNIQGETNITLHIPIFGWSNVGTYCLITSNASGVSTSDLQIVSARRPLLQFDTRSLVFDSSTGAFGCAITGAAGTGNIIVYATTNFADWKPISTNSPVIGAVWFTNAGSPTDAARFYKAVEAAQAGDFQIRLSAAEHQSDGVSGILIRATGLTASGPVAVSYSTNLSGWTPIFTNPPTIGPMIFFEPVSSTVQDRYYRFTEQRW